MQWPFRLGVTQEKTTWGILVIRVIFNTLRVLSSFSNLQIADVSLNSSFESMLAKLKLAVAQLLPNILQGSHEKADNRWSEAVTRLQMCHRWIALYTVTDILPELAKPGRDSCQQFEPLNLMKARRSDMRHRESIFPLSVIPISHSQRHPRRP